MRTLIGALVVWSTAAIGVAAESAPPMPSSTPDGVHFAVWPQRPTRPAPTLFILSGTWQDALGSATYRQAGTQLAERGYLCVSLDLPSHGEFQTPTEKGLTGWRKQIDRGDDVAADVVGRLTKVLDHLIAEGLTDPARVAVCGTSRGGFLALHFSAADSRVGCVAAYCPVTDLAALSEFRGAEDVSLVRELALTQRAEALAEKPIWIIIGDRDVRVDTDRAIALARKITGVALAAQRSPRVDLHVVSNPKGHTTPTGAAEQSADWIDRQLNSAAK